jgi:hypothetical protein
MLAWNDTTLAWALEALDILEVQRHRGHTGVGERVFEHEESILGEGTPGGEVED